MRTIFIGLLFLLSASLWGGSIKKTLDTISLEDQQKLESFFYAIMIEDHGAYTLFGDKPISLAGNFLVTPYRKYLGKDEEWGSFLGMVGYMGTV